MATHPSTDDEDPVVSELLASIKEHRLSAEVLAGKWIGEEELERGRNIADPFFKRQWYGNEIYQLGVAAGDVSRRQRRCKQGGRKWQRYEQTEQEICRVKDFLLRELSLLDRLPAPMKEE